MCYTKKQLKEKKKQGNEKQNEENGQLPKSRKRKNVNRTTEILERSQTQKYDNILKRQIKQK